MIEGTDRRVTFEVLGVWPVLSAADAVRAVFAGGADAIGETEEPTRLP